MKNTSRLLKRLVIPGVFLICLPNDAHAYLDPGTGSYVLQIALAVLFGGLLAIKLFWNKIKSLFTKIFSREKES